MPLLLRRCEPRHESWKVKIHQGKEAALILIWRPIAVRRRDSKRWVCSAPADVQTGRPYS